MCCLWFDHSSFEFFMACPSGCLKRAPERNCCSSEILSPLQSRRPHPSLPHRPHHPEVNLSIRSNSCKQLFTSCLKRKQGLNWRETRRSRTGLPWGPEPRTHPRCGGRGPQISNSAPYGAPECESRAFAFPRLTFSNSEC